MPEKIEYQSSTWTSQSENRIDWNASLIKNFVTKSLISLEKSLTGKILFLFCLFMIISIIYLLFNMANTYSMQNKFEKEMTLLLDDNKKIRSDLQTILNTQKDILLMTNDNRTLIYLSLNLDPEKIISIQNKLKENKDVGK